VHPTKAEVRFLEPSLVHEVLRRAVGDALGQGPSPQLQFQVTQAPAGQDVEPSAQSIPGILAGATIATRWLPAGQAPPPSPYATRADGGHVEPSPSQVERQPAQLAMRPMIALGQFRDTYIIAVDDDGIAIIDQHVAHERVLFEQIMERLSQGRLPSQGLLQPVVIELSPGQREALRAHDEDLARLGFEVEDFGGGSVRASAVPAVLAMEQAAAAIRALAEDLEGLDRGARVEEALRRIAATMACHAAVKANYPLTFEKMSHILSELRRTAYSSVCPHGRPVVLRLTRREIEKNFQRI